MLAGATAVGLGYTAAALAWRAGYAPRLGPPLWETTSGTLLGARCALIVVAGLVPGLMLYGQRRAALTFTLVLVALAPIGAGPVYSPSAGLRWSVQVAKTTGLDSPAGSLAVQAGAAGALLALALLAALTTPAKPKPSAAHGTAAWGQGESMIEAERGLILGRSGGEPPPVGLATERSDRKAGKPGPLLRYDGPGHVLTVAPTRAGKGVGAVVPNLLDYPGPVVVTDPKGENLTLTARYRAHVLGHEVVALDPFDLAPKAMLDSDKEFKHKRAAGQGTIRCGSLNPLDLIVRGSADEFEDAALLAEMLVVDEAGGSGNRFWTDEAKALLSGIILHVALEEDGDRRSVLTVREHLTASAKDFKVLMESMKGSDSTAVKRTVNRIERKHEKELSAIVSTAQSHTHFLDSPRMTDVLGSSTFDPSALRPGTTGGRPLSVYLLLPPDRLDAFSRWLRLCVATTITGLAKLGPLSGAGAPASQRTLFLLDEFAQLGPMPPVQRAFSLMAGYGVQVWPFLQDLGQMRRLYPEDWESFVANSDALQAFGTTDQFTAEYLSKMAGTATVFHHSQSSGRNRGKNTSRSVGAGASETARPLVTPDELRRLGKRDQVLLVRGEDPVLARRIAYYGDSTFTSRVAQASAVDRGPFARELEVGHDK